jgi:hypothetical protein
VEERIKLLFTRCNKNITKRLLMKIEKISIIIILIKIFFQSISSHITEGYFFERR